MEDLCSTPFVDLYIGPDYADVKGMPGVLAQRSPLSGAFYEQAQQLRQQCLAQWEEHHEPEFAIEERGIKFRVTIMQSMTGGPVMFLRRMNSELKTLGSLGLPKPFLTWLLAPERSGLVLICGAQAAGKTTTAASLLSERLKQHGGVALAVEDPPEIDLDGVHGEGRCIQIPASKRFGNHEEQLRRAMRTGISTLMIGEIRCYETSTAAVNQSTNGLFVVSTIHASNPLDAIERLIGYASGDGQSNVRQMISSGLAGVVHQTLTRGLPGEGAQVRPTFKTLCIQGADGEVGMRAKIREGQIYQLATELDAQASKTMWKFGQGDSR